MRFDLIQPCKNCPFVTTEHRITFACLERAEEIEEIAYRKGFVCHEHAECIEDDDFGEGGFDFRADGSSQHCFGALAMYVKEGDANVPWECMTDKQQNRWWKRAKPEGLAIAFDNVAAYMEANT